MIKRVIEFSEALRNAKVPVSLLEVLDASQALAISNLPDRVEVKSFLSATLVKDRRYQKVFDRLFDVYFSPSTYDFLLENDHSTLDLEPDFDGVFDDLSDMELKESVAASLLRGDQGELAGVIASAVARFAGMEAGRPVGGMYYAFKTLRGLDLEGLRNLLIDARVAQLDPGDSLGVKLVNHDVERLLEMVRKLVDDDIRRRLVSDRGADAVARSLRSTLPEDIDFMHANVEDINEMRRALVPLVRKLASRLGRRRRRRHRGALDFRRTFRRSIANGGIPADLFYHRPVPAKPEIIVVADISGSVASFARFTLAMVYALSEQFSKVRSFVFIDEIDEVTSIFEGCDDLEDALRIVSSKAKVVWMDGHSDYGRVIESFVVKWGEEITHRSPVMFLGDARNNYHPSKAHFLGEIRAKARALYWLNPEPAAYWDTGDSIMSHYSLYCDSVDECRNLRQLQSFVERLL